jgi:prepilin-type N-terminal cleavage/methylation domain-containing protein
MKRTNYGFTLVEIAIVLVIIGLLLGGILKGQEMITQAKIKNSVADFSGISAAYHGYQDRYRAIPGDDTNAPGRWTTAPAATKSPTAGEAGNGTLQGKYNSQTDTDETRIWWDDLRRSGFVAGSGYQQPFNAFSGMIGVQTGDAANGTALGGFSGLIMCSSNIPDKVAIAIDTQMDDGMIDKGTLRGQRQAGANPDILATVPAGDIPYQETGTNVYTLCRAF